MNRSLKLLAPLALLVAAAPLQAQFGPSLRGAGMAGAYAGIARGYEAAAWNPALLGLKGQPGWSLALPALDLSATMLGPSVMDMYDVMSKGDDLTDADRQKLLKAIPGSGLELRANGRGSWGGLSVGPVALGIASTGLVSGNIGRELIDLMLYTRQYGDIDPTRLADYRVGNTTARGAAYTTISAAYGTALPLPLLPFPVSVGVGARYVLGHELQRGRIFEPTVNLDRQDIDISVLAVRSTGGSGYAMDLGVAAQPLPWLTVSLAVDNLAQKMTWDEELELRGQSFSGKELSDKGIMDLMDGFEPRPFDPTGAQLGAYELARDLFTQAYFPRTIRAGVGLKTRATGTTLGATYSTVQGKGDLHTGWPKYASLGVEQKLPLLSFITLRGGFASSLDGASALTGGLGLGLGPINLTTAVIMSSGHGEGDNGTNANRFRFAEQMAAGTGFGFFIGLDLISF